MTKKKPAQHVHYVGIVTITEGETPSKGIAYYELRYFDPVTGKDVKRRVSGLSLEEIKVIAKNLNDQANQGKGYLAGRPKAPALGDVFDEVIRLARARKRTKRNYNQAAMLFIKWLGVQYPAVRTWDQLRPAMVQAYVRECETEGMAWDTIRNRLVPVKAAWKHASENWPELVKPLPKIKTAAPPRREIECLDAAELAAVLDWFKAKRPALYPIVCLQGLAGLRMLEAVALRRQDVDLKAGIVTVTKTEIHTPKTRDSYRTIPVCGEVVAALKVAVARQKIRPTTGEIFTTAKGTLWGLNSLSHRMYESFKAAARDLYPPDPKTGELDAATATAKERFLTIPARKLRAAFATLAGQLGAADRLLKAYLGHSSGDILGGHYRRVSLEELRAVSGLMERAEETLSGGEKWKDSGNIRACQIAND